jgi:hypothetical protein
MHPSLAPALEATGTIISHALAELPAARHGRDNRRQRKGLMIMHPS